MKTEIRPENEMKDSGVEWIKHIPCDWDIVPLKRYFQFGKGLPITKADLQETGEKVISYGQIHAKFNTGVSVDDRLIRFVSSDYKLTNASSLCSKGDIILADTSEDKEGCGNAVYIDYDEKIFAGYHTITLKSDRNNKYLAYLFQSDSWREQIQKRVNGVKLFSITKKILNQCTIILPSSSEQQAIVDYLDEVCSKIDEIIAEAKASIEEYKELKQAVIVEAVTKGLYKNVEVKETGEKWLHSIPKHWRMEKGKRLLFETNYRSVNGQEELLTVSQYTGITPRSKKNVTMFQAESLVDYKICEVGDIAANTMWMWAGAVGVSRYRGIISPSYNTYRQKRNDYNSDYLDYLLRIAPLVDEYASLSTGIRASRLRLYPTQFLSINYPVPPLVEQMAIVDWLNEQLPKYDSLITEKEALIADLEAYKKSLIYELVTGKRRVV